MTDPTVIESLPVPDPTDLSVVVEHLDQVHSDILFIIALFGVLLGSILAFVVLWRIWNRGGV